MTETVEERAQLGLHALAYLGEFTVEERDGCWAVYDEYTGKLLSPAKGGNAHWMSADEAWKWMDERTPIL